MNPRKDSDLRDLAKDKEREARFETEVIETVVDHTTPQFYTEIVLFQGGSKAMDIYIKLYTPLVSSATNVMGFECNKQNVRQNDVSRFICSSIVSLCRIATLRHNCDVSFIVMSRVLFVRPL